MPYYFLFELTIKDCENRVKKQLKRQGLCRLLRGGLQYRQRALLQVSFAAGTSCSAVYPPGALVR
jgi:hypothetical protein